MDQTTTWTVLSNGSTSTQFLTASTPPTNPMKIYTRTGDGGQTGLLNGKRVAKNHPRVAAYGDVDELNAVLGLTRSLISDPGIQNSLVEVQRDLLSLGAQLADPDSRNEKRSPKASLAESRVAELERQIDEWEAQITPLQNFILPGGSQAAACLHVARTVCRRAERQTIHLSQQETVPPLSLTYLNRLSDFLFVLARYVNHKANVLEIPW
jgi:cob(I)alamin adenosyltransferase